MILKSNKPGMILWGNEFVFTSVLSIILSALIGVLLIQYLRLLTRNEHEKQHAVPEVVVLHDSITYFSISSHK